MSLIASDNFKIVIGLGKTGLACARFLAGKGVAFSVCDSRENPPGADELAAEFPDVELRCGDFDANYLKSASELILSPGVAQSEPAIREAVAAGVKLSGDIDLFCREVTAPIIAITGSNAKSTVTVLVGEMAAEAGLNVGVCGNIGTPVLDMLQEAEKDLYVMELSSFQLETANDLRAEVATVLNISPDHLDRYDSMQDYYKAKHRIFRGAKHVVINRDDALTSPLLPTGVDTRAYHLGKPDLKLFGLIEEEGETYLALGLEKLLPVSELKIRGSHNMANALAALALGQAAGLPIDAMLNALRDFGGLDHRCQWVADKKGVSYFNDSKGTNVGATVAALNGLGETLQASQKIILVAGGVGKGAEFSELAAPMAQYCRALVYIGEDGQQLADACGEIEKQPAEDMFKAVQTSAGLAQEGDIVLLSPACASFDMFSGFPERGEKFVAAVAELGNSE
ncbi:UDP-N-acetylmuramoyl-L-alanine--D-glutamate ligase [Neptuniibacter sp.]|uniref:UDP-N-acetylmuramoyl-L-alanine--D-glutamate ligase n=1 Tax=Neptuniibacter sp. TaxID=1962643 RepID=UPI002637C354|nr:UDP-N-acetylmuramoyl-L-alanine--D-glutamate ligase [Neptuniibacter sp.]MCP4598141.1 UDP-N-acetylmuramoyl-L-alanine--D-glutamate ligase [Neptuniibacter sp.]